MDLGQSTAIRNDGDSWEKKGKHVQESSEYNPKEISRDDVCNRMKESDTHKARRRPSTGRLTGGVGDQGTEQSRPLRLRRRQSTGGLVTSESELDSRIIVKTLAARVAKQVSTPKTNFGDIDGFGDPFEQERKSAIAKRSGHVTPATRNTNCRSTITATRNTELESDTTINAAAFGSIISSREPSLGFDRHSASTRSVARSQSDDAMRDRSLREIRQNIGRKEFNAPPPNATLLQLKASLVLAKANLATAPKPDKRTVLASVRRLSLSGRNLLDDAQVNETQKPVKKQLIRRSSIVADLSSEYTTGKMQENKNL
jgi:hypothetical protein